MLRRLRSFYVLAALVTVLNLVAAVGVSQVLAEGKGRPTEKRFTNPELGLSDEERLARHAAAHERNRAYLAAFVTQNRDPRQLPRIDVPGYAPVIPTLAKAVEQAEVVVAGRVQSVTFASNPSGGLPIATAIIAVDRAVKGSPPPALTLVQLGGPVAQEVDGALAQVDHDELVLAGDEVILLLTRDPVRGVFRTLPAAGVYFVEHGIVRAQRKNAFRGEVQGQPRDAVLARLAALAAHGR